MHQRPNEKIVKGGERVKSTHNHNMTTLIIQVNGVAADVARVQDDAVLGPVHAAVPPGPCRRVPLGPGQDPAQPAAL